MKIIFDYNRTLFDPETRGLYFGAIDLLEKIYQQNELYIVGRNEPGRKENIKKLGLNKYFKGVYFVDEKTKDIFKELLSADNKTVVIGDRVREEILIGNSLGCVTIWLKQGKFSSELPRVDAEKPKYVVKKLAEIESIIKSI